MDMARVWAWTGPFRLTPWTGSPPCPRPNRPVRRSISWPAGPYSQCYFILSDHFSLVGLLTLFDQYPCLGFRACPSTGQAELSFILFIHVQV